MQNKYKFEIDDFVFQRCIGYSAIQNRTQQIAAKINEDFKDKSPIFVITMKGAIFFAMELLKRITINHTTDTISAKSYNGVSSSGIVSIQHTTTDWENKHIIIIEDIVDTGLTIRKLQSEIAKQNPASIAICTLIKKPMADTLNIDIKYWGFEMKQEDFIIGFGLDYKEYGRNLTGLYTLERQ